MLGLLLAIILRIIRNIRWMGIAFFLGGSMCEVIGGSRIFLAGAALQNLFFWFFL